VGWAVVLLVCWTAYIIIRIWDDLLKAEGLPLLFITLLLFLIIQIKILTQPFTYGLFIIFLWFWYFGYYLLNINIFKGSFWFSLRILILLNILIISRVFIKCLLIDFICNLCYIFEIHIINQFNYWIILSWKILLFYLLFTHIENKGIYFVNTQTPLIWIPMRSIKSIKCRFLNICYVFILIIIIWHCLGHDCIELGLWSIWRILLLNSQQVYTA